MNRRAHSKSQKNLPFTILVIASLCVVAFSDFRFENQTVLNTNYRKLSSKHSVHHHPVHLRQTVNSSFYGVDLSNYGTENGFPLQFIYVQPQHTGTFTIARQIPIDFPFCKYIPPVGDNLLSEKVGYISRRLNPDLNITAMNECVWNEGCLLADTRIKDLDRWKAANLHSLPIHMKRHCPYSRFQKCLHSSFGGNKTRTEIFLASLFKIGTIRDPWSRIISSAVFHCVIPSNGSQCRHHLRSPSQMTSEAIAHRFRIFARRVSSEEVTPLSTMLTQLDESLGVDQVIETSDLSDGYQKFCSKMGHTCGKDGVVFAHSHCISSCSKTNLTTSSQSNSSEIMLNMLYDAETWDFVAKKFSSDLRMFDFKHAPARPIWPE